MNPEKLKQLQKQAELVRIGGKGKLNQASFHSKSNPLKLKNEKTNFKAWLQTNNLEF